MKRSEINAIMRAAVKFIQDSRFQMPPFAYWQIGDWQTKGVEYQEIFDNQLGWDITDFGSGRFADIGLLMFTIRNGNFDAAHYPKPYAEKIMIVEEGQVTPYHYHTSKMEDIINRGGGNLIVKIYNANQADGLAGTPVMAEVDGRRYPVAAGAEIRLQPGESITLPQRMYHSFWGERGSGAILVGEVSKVNDDQVDNHFLEPVGRFPAIAEDEEPLYLLSMDYSAKLKR